MRDRLVALGDRVALHIVGSEVDDAAPVARELREEDEVQGALAVELLSVLAAEHRPDGLDEDVVGTDLLQVLLEGRVVEAQVGAARRGVEVARTNAGRH